MTDTLATSTVVADEPVLGLEAAERIGIIALPGTSDAIATMTTIGVATHTTAEDATVDVGAVAHEREASPLRQNLMKTNVIAVQFSFSSLRLV